MKCKCGAKKRVNYPFGKRSKAVYTVQNCKCKKEKKDDKHTEELV